AQHRISVRDLRHLDIGAAQAAARLVVRRLGLGQILRFVGFAVGVLGQSGAARLHQPAVNHEGVAHCVVLSLYLNRTGWPLSALWIAACESFNAARLPRAELIGSLPVSIATSSAPMVPAKPSLNQLPVSAGCATPSAV